MVQKNAGFTIAEMAVVIVIMSLLLVMGTQAFTAYLAFSQRKLTTERSAKISAALTNFYLLNRRLPCPDIGGGAGYTGTAPAACNAATGWGIVPYQTLGLMRQDVSDGYGNFFLYQITPTWSVAITTANACTPAPNPVPVAAPGPFAQNILVQDRNIVTGLLSPVAPTNNAVAVIVSHGANAFSAISAKSTIRTGARQAAPPATNFDERQNTRLGTDPNPNIFVTRSTNDNPAATGGLFDDDVTAISGIALFNRVFADRFLICQ